MDTDGGRGWDGMAVDHRSNGGLAALWSAREFCVWGGCLGVVVGVYMGSNMLVVEVN